MADEQLIAYYKEHNKPDPWWWPPILMLCAIAIIPLAIFFMFFAVLWSLLESAWKKITRQSNPEVNSPVDRLNQKGIKLFVGYSGDDSEASDIAKTIADKYGPEANIYDWSSVISLDKDARDNLSQNEKDAFWLLEGDNETNVGTESKIQNEKSPTTVYAIAICDDYYQFLTAFPLLDDWHRPTKVLNVEKFYQRVDEYMKEGTIYGHEG